jgi:8-oxo-dGTP diphosphatase
MQQEKKLKVGVAVVLFDADHNILLGKRLNVLGEGTWGLPGGHQKIGESIEECARREVKEEVGIDLQKMELLEVSEMVETGLDYQLVEIGYESSAWEGILELREHKYCSEWKFFSPKELPKELFSAHEAIIKKALALHTQSVHESDTKTLYNTIHTQFKIAVQAFVINSQGQLLMGLRKDYMDKGNWGLPGGHLDVGETLEECVIREVEEETGLKALSALQFASVEQPITHSEKHYLHFGYIIKDFVPGELINGEPDDIDHWEWFDIDKIPANVAPTQRQMILKFLKFSKIPLTKH